MGTRYMESGRYLGGETVAWLMAEGVLTCCIVHRVLMKCAHDTIQLRLIINVLPTIAMLHHLVGHYCGSFILSHPGQSRWKFNSSQKKIQR